MWRRGGDRQDWQEVGLLAHIKFAPVIGEKEAECMMDDVDFFDASQTYRTLVGPAPNPEDFVNPWKGMISISPNSNWLVRHRARCSYVRPIGGEEMFQFLGYDSAWYCSNFTDRLISAVATTEACGFEMCALVLALMSV